MTTLFKRCAIFITIILSMSQNSKSQGPSKNGGENKREANHNNKQSRKVRPKNKTNGHQIIHKEQNNTTERKAYDSSDLFLSSLARKCNNFFDWVSNTHSDTFPELLWKNEMMIQASQLYPELNNSELARLVDRDWKYMPEQERNKICQIYSRMPSGNELEEVISNCDPKLLY